MKNRPIFDRKDFRRPVLVGLFMGNLAIGAVQAFAEDPVKTAQSKEELATLEQLLKMPKEDLKRMRLTLESIEKMGPTDRRKALQRIQHLNKMSAESRKETINRWTKLSPELKKAYFDHLRKLSDSDRKKFQELPWEKQSALVNPKEK